MKRNSTILIAVFSILILILVIASPVIAKKGHMKLLAASKTTTGYIGETADLYLEIKPGSGRVYLETFPLTKIDTQISTRYANSIACKILKKDCGKYDFFYTIQSDSAIIGGPSAGASIAVLTMSLLENNQIDESVAMTGTINSGGFVGPVGKISEKIKAAADEGIKKVLVPSTEIDDEGYFTDEEAEIDALFNGSLKIKNITNRTNMFELEKRYNIDIVPISDVYEAYYEFTGSKIEKETGEIILPEDYSNVMYEIAKELCNRASILRNDIDSEQRRLNKSQMKIYEEALNLTKKASSLLENKMFYSAASRCYGACVYFQKINLELSNLSDRNLALLIAMSRKQAESFNYKVENSTIETLTDLEAYMIAKERLIEAQDHLVNAKNAFEIKDREQVLSELAMGIERIYSAKSWYTFLGTGKVKYKVDKSALKESCEKKIKEVEEKIEYINLLTNEKFEDIKKSIDYAYIDLKNEKYALCLFEASKADAEVSTVLSTMEIEEKNLDKLIKKKLEFANQVIYSQIMQGNFPILGYSYYEYAQELYNTSKYSTLLYTEYAMELSNLDIYFEKKKSLLYLNIEKSEIYLFLSGLVVGVIVSFVVLIISIKKKTKVMSENIRKFGRVVTKKAKLKKGIINKRKHRKKRKRIIAFY